MRNTVREERQSHGAVAVHRLHVALKVMLAGERMAAVASGTHERLLPVRVVRVHMRLQVMLAGRH
jgi:hypothetical protein